MASFGMSSRKMKTKPLSFHAHKFRNNIILITFPWIGLFYSFWDYFSTVFFTVRDLLLIILLFTLFDDDDYNYLIANICWSFAQLRYFCLPFPLFYFLFTLGKLFLFICEVNWKKGHWTQFMIFLFSTEIFTLYSMKLLLELLFFFLLFIRSVGDSSIEWCLTFFLKLSSLSVYKHCSIITLKRWWRFTRKLTNIYMLFYIYEITN